MLVSGVLLVVLWGGSVSAQGAAGVQGTAGVQGAAGAQGTTGVQGTESSSCAGPLALAVFLTLLVVFLLQAAAYLLWKAYWKGKSGQHLVLVTDPEKGESVFAFDNPGFKEGPPTIQPEEKESQKLKWPHWTSMGLVTQNNTKVKSMDDSYTAQPALNVVPLRSHDFTGLGFNVCGNMRDGIFVKDVLHRGPASESGRITPGDRIESVKISLRHMVLEDALTILSYASPYEVELAVETRSGGNGSTLLRTPPPPHRICHPFYRSHSISDLQQIGKSNSRRMGEQQPSSLMSDISNETTKPATLDRKPKMVEAERNQNTRNCIIESVQKTDNIFHTIELEGKDEVDKVDKSTPKETSPNHVKSLLVKGIQNLKDKLQHSLHTEDLPKDEQQKSSKDNSRSSTMDKREAKQEADDGFKSVELIVANCDVPEEVTRAGNMARSNRKSIIDDTADLISDEDPIAAKRNKRKAPMPPQVKEDEEEINQSLDSVDSDSEAGDKGCITIELNSSHITVHHAPDTESRKASSLGDLSRYDTENVIVLERAVSLDLADGAPGCKKRKAPMPPQEDCLTPYKEARLESGTGQGTLKKSSVWGTLEDVIQTGGSDSETDLGISGCSTPENAPPELPTSTPLNSVTWELSYPPDSSEFVTAVNGDDTPPELPTSPMPTLHSYITEIQVTSGPKSHDTSPGGQFIHLDGTDQLMDHIYKFESVTTPEITTPEPTQSETVVSIRGADSPPCNDLDNGSSPLPKKSPPEVIKPARSNVTVTNLKTSRIPVRAKSPGSSLSPASDKRSFNHRNGHGSP